MPKLCRFHQGLIKAVGGKIISGQHRLNLCNAKLKILHNLPTLGGRQCGKLLILAISCMQQAGKHSPGPLMQKATAHQVPAVAKRPKVHKALHATKHLKSGAGTSTNVAGKTTQLPVQVRTMTVKRCVSSLSMGTSSSWRARDSILLRAGDWTAQVNVGVDGTL